MSRAYQIEQKFNDDLLVHTEDRERAASLYPGVYHVLDHPELRDLFQNHDKIANASKRRNRIAGLCAVGLGALALVIAAVEQLQHGGSHVPGAGPGFLSYLAAAAALASFIFGFCGIMTARRKREWLAQRLMTESLRQFHFQSMACRLTEIARSLESPQAQSEFVRLRAAWFQQFSYRFEGKLAAELEAILSEIDEEQLTPWLHPPKEYHAEGLPSEGLAELFNAYRELRLRHQWHYASFQLRSDMTGLAAPRSQEALFFLVGAVGVVVMLGLHLGGLFVEGASNLGLLYFISTVIAVALLVVRALEEGLKPDREVERYTRYRLQMRSLLARFDAAETVAERAEIMLEAERASYEEMCSFLHTQNESRFVL